MATCSSILAWRIPWTEEPGGLQSMGCKGLDATEQLSLHYLSTVAYVPRQRGRVAAVTCIES